MRRVPAIVLAVLALAAVPAWSQAPQGGRAIPVTAAGSTVPPQTKALRTKHLKAKPVKAAAAGGVTIKDFSFAPGSVSVNVGDTVTWSNSGKTAHTATASDGSFDTGQLKPGQSGSHTFTQAGTFHYICSLHPFMKGTVVVAAAAGATSPRSAGSHAATPATPAPAAAPAKPGIPNTGVNVGWMLLSGAMLLASGLLLRRRAA
jgi:LPXTG-motif cell wall-anchored protein